MKDQPVVTIGGRVVMRKGQPVTAGDLPQTFKIDPETWELIEIADWSPDKDFPADDKGTKA